MLILDQLTTLAYSSVSAILQIMSLLHKFFYRLNSGNFKRPSHGGVRLQFIAQTSILGVFGLSIWPLPRFSTYSKVDQFHIFIVLVDIPILLFL